MDNPERDESGDWPSDFHLENGQYYCTCLRCESAFLGHKHRSICRRCSRTLNRTTINSLRHKLTAAVRRRIGQKQYIRVTLVDDDFGAGGYVDTFPAVLDFLMSAEDPLAYTLTPLWLWPGQVAKLGEFDGF